MSDDRKISPVTDNLDKHNTYRLLLGRYKIAVKNEFYFEAMLIVYALMEDRLRSFLYYIGALRDKSSVKLNVGVVKKHIKEMLVSEMGAKETEHINVQSIQGKMKLIRATLLWTENGCTGKDSNKYLSALSEMYQSIDITALLKAVDDISEWCKYRNEVIHSVMNKNMDSLNTELASRIEKGMELARIIDNTVKVLKRKNNVRRMLKLGNM